MVNGSILKSVKRILNFVTIYQNVFNYFPFHGIFIHGVPVGIETFTLD